jgi:DNA invertase Pin-like site-specific DNA recombinase
MSKDRGQEDSPERQRAQILPHCQRQGYQVVEEYFDPGITGDEFVKRAAFQRLLRDARAGRFDGIVVDHKDRLSRQNTVDYIADVVRPLRDAGVWVESVAGGRIDWDSLAGLLTDHIQQHQASEESPTIGYRTLTELLAKARRGEGAGGPVPYAYVMTYREEVVKGQVRKIPVRYALGDPDKVKVVKWLFEQYASGKRSIEQLRDELHARCVPGPRGTAWWGKTTIVRILKNRRYLGDWVYNQSHCGKWVVGEGGKVERSKGGRKIRPRKNAEADWVVVPDWHPAIIDRETFAKVQARLQRNCEHKTPVKGHGSFALANLLVCGSCGLPMWGFNERDEAKYRCSGNMRFGGGFCGCNTVRERAVLPAIVAALQAELLDPDFLAQTEAEVLQKAQEAQEAGAADQLQAAIDDLGKKIDQGNRNLALLPPDRLPGVVAAIRDWEAERDRLQAELNRVVNDSDLYDLRAVVAGAKKVLWDLKAAVQEGDPALVRGVLTQFVSRVELDFAPRVGKRNRSPLVGGTIYLRDDRAEDLQTVSSSTVRSHMHHGLAALRKYLEPRLR